jgi:hypothetical protein
MARLLVCAPDGVALSPGVGFCISLTDPSYGFLIA